MLVSDITEGFRLGKFDKKLEALYGKGAADSQRLRYAEAASEFMSLYGNADAVVLSVAGRSEISGNHTDHNKGCVLAASVDLDIIAVAAKTNDSLIRIKSRGFDEDVANLSSLSDGSDCRYTSKAIICGVCDGFEKKGYKTGAFCAYTTSSVLKGSGLSSSAAFEDMTGYILSQLYNDGNVPPVEIAKISQYAENVFFGKPCGLMDQVACAVGGFVFIDFGGDEPVIEPIQFDLSGAGYDLCIVNTGGNHADLNDDYASIPADMKACASYFGKPVLRSVTEEEFISAIPALRTKFGDKAVLRGLHFIRENKRVCKQRDALHKGDLDGFLTLAGRSGDSSYKYLQNVYTVKNPDEQGLSLAICISDGLLAGEKAAVRVHGGGFAGTIQAFVPKKLTEKYKSEMEKVFGSGSCSVLKVRAQGVARII